MLALFLLFSKNQAGAIVEQKTLRNRPWNAAFMDDKCGLDLNAQTKSISFQVFSLSEGQGRQQFIN